MPAHAGPALQDTSYSRTGYRYTGTGYIKAGLDTRTRFIIAGLDVGTCRTLYIAGLETGIRYSTSYQYQKPKKKPRLSNQYK